MSEKNKICHVMKAPLNPTNVVYAGWPLGLWATWDFIWRNICKKVRFLRKKAN